jgi:hypothetical protein
MRKLQVVLCITLLAPGLANAVPVDCNTLSTLAQYIAATDGCFVQDKLFTSFTYTGGGPVTAANVRVTAVFSAVSDTGIHGFTLTPAPGMPVWEVGFTWGYTISVIPPNPANINSAKIQGNFGDLPPNAATATSTKNNGLVQSINLGSETGIEVFAPVPSLTSSTTVTIPSGGFLISLAEIYTQGGNVPPRRTIITGAGPGGGPHVRLVNAVTGAEIFSFFAYAPTFAGGVRVASGDVNGDGVPDIITGAGPGGGPHVRVFDGAAAVAGSLVELLSFFAYHSSFTGGVFVGAADLNGDGKADIITGAGSGGGPHVRVFDGATGAPLVPPDGGFFAYDPNFTGGVFVAGFR